MLGKLQNILSGWRGYIWESPATRLMAESRALNCATCEHAEHGVVISFLNDEVKEIKGMKCGLCDCPLSALLRSPNEKCKLDKW